MNVCISGREIQVLLKPSRSMKQTYGIFKGESMEIWLAEKQPTYMRRQTLIHECFHAFLYVTGYNELLEEVSPHFEEAMCRGIEQSLESLFIFNEDIETWIKG
jgi:hypothetical protein